MKAWFLVVLLVLSVFCFSAVKTQAYSSLKKPPLLLFNTTIKDAAPSFTGYYSFSAYRPILPNITPENIKIATNVVFNNTGPVPYTTSVQIPKGEFALELLNVSVKEYGGAQYDRPLYVFANGVPLFWGSTQEIANSTAVSDVTLFEKLLQGSVSFEIVLVNYYYAPAGITGVYSVNVSLLLYPGAPPAGLPNEFVPLWVNRFGYSAITLSSLSPSYTQSLELPNGTQRALALVYTEGGGLDEFWYANEPATRSIQLYYNSRLAAVFNPYETVYTGGIDLFYWKPEPSINTLSYHNPYIAELTPLLATGLNATITVSVSNLLAAYEITGVAAFYWTLSGVLLLWVNPSDPLLQAKLMQAQSQFTDSGAIFNPTFSGLVYQEAGHYLLNYTSLLVFESGSELSHVEEEGTFDAHQTLSAVLEVATLDESFSESANDSGLYDAALTYQASYPVRLVYGAFVTPLTNPSVIPYYALFAQNGSLAEGYYVKSEWIYGGYNYTQSVKEKEVALGGFSAELEVINSYGGAVLISLYSNYGSNEKWLSASWITQGREISESFYAKGVSPNVTDLEGYYAFSSLSYNEEVTNHVSHDPASPYIKFEL